MLEPSPSQIEVDIVSMNLNEHQAIQMLQLEMGVGTQVERMDMASGDSFMLHGNHDIGTQVLDQTFESIREPQEPVYLEPIS
jgi:hypothetical protein